MIQFNFDTTTGVVRLAAPSFIKTGADVRVKVVFSSAVGEDTVCALALGTDAAPPVVLAFTEDFTRENSTTWLALLDANDTRLVDFMAAKGSTQVNAELTCIIDGEKQVAPNVAITVQPAIVSGPESTEGGPTYYTQAQVDAMLVRLLPGVTGYTGGTSANLDGLVTVGAAFNVVQFVHATEGLRSYQLVTGTDAEASPGIIRPDDYHASTNAKVWKSV